jgi:hypothetical protein
MTTASADRRTRGLAEPSSARPTAGMGALAHSPPVTTPRPTLALLVRAGDDHGPVPAVHDCVIGPSALHVGGVPPSARRCGARRARTARTRPTSAPSGPPAATPSCWTGSGGSPGPTHAHRPVVVGAADVRVVACRCVVMPYRPRWTVLFACGSTTCGPRPTGGGSHARLLRRRANRMADVAEQAIGSAQHISSTGRGRRAALAQGCRIDHRPRPASGSSVNGARRRSRP